MTNETSAQTKKSTIWKGIKGAVAAFLIIATLVLASCGPAATTTTQTVTQPPSTAVTKQPNTALPLTTAAPETPKYGGTLRLAVNADQTVWDPMRSTPSQGALNAMYQKLWEGDWVRGPAGGYGTNEITWITNNDVLEFKTGFIAESWKWTIGKDQGTIVYQIRQGIHWASNPASEASNLVGSRELTADDVVYCFKKNATGSLGYMYGASPELRTADIARTGRWEVTVKVPLDAMYTAICRFGDGIYIYPPEIMEKYGSMTDWKTSLGVGTGAFILSDYVQGSVITLVRNPRYWMNDPVGPGKGNQLPYADGVKQLIIPDASTRLAAIRTGKIDQMKSLSMEDAAETRKTAPSLLEVAAPAGSPTQPLFMRIDKTPFNDIRVRRAMMMAIDFQAISKSLYDGVAPIPTFPFTKVLPSPYEEALLGLNDPDFPESAKELYSFNPDKSKQLLKEAGYSDGFKTEVMLQSADVDYYSIIAAQFAKVGIDMKLDVREAGAFTAVTNARTHTAMATRQVSGVADFIKGLPFAQNYQNLSMISDPYINATMAEVRTAALTDQHEAMSKYRELTKYVVQQAYAIPNVTGPTFTFWWPWVKNYSGESMVGSDDSAGWYPYLWIDEARKKSMGY